jgi:hypothetical protein
VLDSVPDLSPKIVNFALQHRSGMHDIFLLIQFATDLANSGNKSGALALFSNLLRLWTGKLDQTAVIKRCLAFCWLEVDSAPPAAVPAAQPAHTAPVARDQSTAACKAGSEPQYDIAAILEFIRLQKGLRAPEFVTVLANLGVPRGQLIQICKGILTQHAPPSRSMMPDSAGVRARTSGCGDDTWAPWAELVGKENAGAGGVAGTADRAPSGEARQAGGEGDAAGTCGKVAEALALVPRLLELVEADIREDATAQIVAVERELGDALGLDPGVAEVPSMCDAQPPDAPRRRARAPRRRSVERVLAGAAALGAALLPGGLGRLLAAAPALLLLSRS